MSSGFTVVLGEKYKQGSHDEKLRRRIRSLLRFTYRRDFPAFEPYGITSDSGWGCMLRSAQTLMGNTFLRHKFGRDWRLAESRPEIIKDEKYIEILSWFLDAPGAPHYYALHHMVQCGIKYSKLPGEWFGPSTVALVLRDIAEIQRKKYGGTLSILVANGDTIYRSDVKRVCQGVQNAKEADECDPLKADTPSPDYCYDPLLHQPPEAKKEPWQYSLLALFPLRLGIEKVNEEYYQALKEALDNKYCIGILGGWPNHALYFAGYNNNNQILGLDPHTTYCSVSIDENFPKEDYLSQVHVNELEHLDFSRLDPSLTVGFYFHDQDDFDEWFSDVKTLNKSKLDNDETTLFQVDEVAPSYLTNCSAFDDDNDDEENIDQQRQVQGKLQSDIGYDGNDDDVNEDDIDDEEEYVILPDFK